MRFTEVKKNLLKPNKIAESRRKCTSASKDCYARPLLQALQGLDKSLEKPTAQKCTLDNYVLSTEVEQQIFSVIITVQCIHLFIVSEIWSTYLYLS